MWYCWKIRKCDLWCEDSGAQTDMNVVMTEKDEFIEVQATAEENPSKRAIDKLCLSKRDKELITIQKED